jgi:DNA-binding NtrC family response regulator
VEAKVSKRSLLLVDDESSFRTLIGRELTRAGYEIEGAGNLDEARHALGRRSFDLVLLDVRMPDGSGLELLPEIKEQWPATEVLMLTAYGTVEEAIRAMKLGAYDFLTKPCKLSELEAALEKACENAAAAQQHRPHARSSGCSRRTASSGRPARCASCSTSSRAWRAPTPRC